MIKLYQEHHRGYNAEIAHSENVQETQPYAELCVTTNFTFLKGASHPEEYIARAAELDLEAIAITDTNSLAGVVRAYSALQEL